MQFPVTVEVDSKGKHSITTVWLLSLLSKRQLNPSRKESFSKVSKRNIIDVSIPDTCLLLQKDDWDIPLKQISHLLYGVSLCYTKKADFVLEELTHLLTQLQRSLSVTERFSSTVAKEKQFKGQSDLTKTKFLTDLTIFEDDPSFDINNIPNFEFFICKQELGRYQQLESVQIKKKDLLNELTNVNILTVNNSEFSDIHTVNRNFTLEELPVDFDLDLDVGDIISQHGTSMTSSSSIRRNDPDFQFREEGRDNISTDQFNRDVNMGMDFDLELQAEDSGTGDDVENAEQTVGQNCENKEGKKRKLSFTERKGQCTLKKIKVDIRISLSTELLKSYYDTYLETMRHRREKRAESSYHDILQNVVSLSDKTKLLGKCWNFTFSKDLQKLVHEDEQRATFSGGFHMDSIDKGRRAVSISETSNIFMDAEDDDFMRQQDRLPQDMLLHLDQIDEELNDEGQEPGLFLFDNNSDFMKQPLNLPSSSFGRSTTRTSSDNSVEEKRDFIDILKMSKNTNSPPLEFQEEVNDTLESFVERRSKKIKLIQDQQAVKFYSYLCSKLDQLKQADRELETNETGLPFNYLIPTTVEDFKTRDNVLMTKQLAANAFFSLLDLASQDIIEFATPISEYVPVCFDNFSILL